MATPSVANPRVAPRRRARLRRPAGDAPFGYGLLVPAATLIVGLVGYPFVRALWLSFHKKLLGAPTAPWIGLDNYTALLADPRFRQAVRNVFVFTSASVALKLLIGLAIALILNEAIPLRALWRSLVLLPYAMPTLVSVLIWKWMYNDTAGVLNYLLNETNIREGPMLWLADPGKAMGSVIAVNVWRGFPFFVITLLAGLQAVPQELYEAAKVDGAGVWARFRAVTLPGLLPVMAVVTLFSTILTFNDFAIIWVLTRGGPGNATDVLATLTYKIAIPGLELGKGVAVSVLMLPILVVLIVLLSRFINRREELA
ncbi:MAG: sugar ABC transporter permease [Chloroflexota bacterium]|nr:sugar ABC transporter permease [Chloroflexota bacterium]MDP9470806.1 sugar ABC transporter permease [Chloroflexota bacterium]